MSFEKILASTAQARRWQTHGVPLLIAQQDKYYPLSFFQEPFWRFSQANPNSAFDNLPYVFTINGDLNLAALEQSLNEVRRRHASLRTTFQTVAGQPVQVVNPYVALPLPLDDLRSLPETMRQDRSLELKKIEAQTPFDLTKDPLLRAKVIQLSFQEYRLLITVHHIAFDYSSLNVFFREFEMLYKGFTSDAPVCLPELPIQYTDFSVWQRSWLQGEALIQQAAYWKRYLAHELPTVKLPRDRPQHKSESLTTQNISLQLPMALTEALRLSSKRHETTLFVMLLATFKMLLYYQTGQTDLAVGTPVSVRHRPEFIPMIGLFMHALALRTDLSDQPTFSELLQRVSQVTLGALANCNIPLRQLLAELALVQNIRSGPLIQIRFNVINTNKKPLNFPNTVVKEHHFFPPTNADLGLLVFDQGAGGILIEWRYDADIFAKERIIGMTQQYLMLLEQVIGNPELPVNAYAH
jgi:Condensation domain